MGRIVGAAKDVTGDATGQNFSPEAKEMRRELQRFGEDAFETTKVDGPVPYLDPTAGPGSSGNID